jgi:hypothetical protein
MSNEKRLILEPASAIFRECNYDSDDLRVETNANILFRNNGVIHKMNWVGSREFSNLNRWKAITGNFQIEHDKLFNIPKIDVQLLYPESDRFTVPLNQRVRIWVSIDPEKPSMKLIPQEIDWIMF